MRNVISKSLPLGIAVVASTLLLALNVGPSFADADPGTKKSQPASGKTMMPGTTMGRLMMPKMNPENGKNLFVNKGCVACHAVNGVGGHDAPAMDAHEMDNQMNPFDFSAKMWNHAPGMIAAQEEAFGEMIEFTGEELADIIAFVHSETAQHGFNESDLTATAKKMMAHEHGGMEAPESHADEVGHDQGESMGDAKGKGKPMHQ